MTWEEFNEFLLSDLSDLSENIRIKIINILQNESIVK
jgi:hypothetical protein